MSDPDFISQSMPALSPSDQAEWLRTEADKARSQGMEWGRASQNGKNGVVLLEYWKKRPDDEGAPRFQPHEAKP